MLFIRPIIMLMLAMCWANTVIAGMSATPTRLIYSEKDKSNTVTIKNTGKNVFLASAKIEGDGVNYFTITPPLIRVEPESKFALRIKKISIEKLPDDKESVFYYTVTMITGSEKPEHLANRIAIGSKFWFKLFYRPKKIGKFDSSRCDLVFNNTTSGIYVLNRTPFYSTFVYLAVDGVRVDLSPEQAMIAPNKSSYISKAKNAKTVEWSRINDFGGIENKCMFSLMEKK